MASSIPNTPILLPDWGTALLPYVSFIPVVNMRPDADDLTRSLLIVDRLVSRSMGILYLGCLVLGLDLTLLEGLYFNDGLFFGGGVTCSTSHTCLFRATHMPRRANPQVQRLSSHCPRTGLQGLPVQAVQGRSSACP